MPSSSDTSGQTPMQYSPPQESESLIKEEENLSNRSINDDALHNAAIETKKSNQAENTEASANVTSESPAPLAATTLIQEPKSRPSAQHLPLRKRFAKDSPAPRPFKKQMAMATMADNTLPKHSPSLENTGISLHSKSAPSEIPVTGALTSMPSNIPHDAQSSVESTTSESGETTETDEEIDVRQSDQNDRTVNTLPRKSTFIIQPIKPASSEYPSSAPSIPQNAQIPKKAHFWSTKTHSPGGSIDEDEDIDIVNSPRDHADLTPTAGERYLDGPKPSISDQTTVKKAKRGRPPLAKRPLVGDVPAKNRKNSTGRPQIHAKSPSQSRNALYCICQKPYDAPRFMIACDKCNQWFHGECIGISEKDGVFIDQYFCGECAKETGKSTTWKQRCANPACNKAARIGRQGYVSKYCSEACGLQVARARLELAEIKRRAASPDSATVPELAMAKQRWLRLGSFADYDDRQRLQRVREERIETKGRLKIVGWKRVFLRSLKPLGEDVCGFDTRLTWADETWQRVRDVLTDEAGVVQLKFDVEEDEKREHTVCRHGRKKCRHKDWQTLMAHAFEQERKELLQLLSLLQVEREQIKTRMKRRRDEHDIASSMANGRIVYTQKGNE